MLDNTEYWMDPEDVKFDTKFSSFNKEKPQAEYNALKLQIERGEQEDPILMKNNLCGDGVNRVRIAKELGRKVRAVNVDPSLTDMEYIMKCNKAQFTGRNPSSTQKAIQAFKLVSDYGYTDIEAMKMIGLPTGTKAVGFVRAIKSSKFDKQFSILEELEKGNAANIDGHFTKSIEKAKRLVRAMEEKEYMDNSVLENQEGIHIDYNTLIETEYGTNLFWNIVGSDTITSKTKIIELINGHTKAAKEIYNLKQRLHNLEIDKIQNGLSIV